MDTLLEGITTWAKDNGALGICLLFSLWTIKWLLGKMINGFNEAMTKGTVALERTLATLERIERVLQKNGD